MAVQGFKLSPDGRYLAFTAPDGGVDRVWIRPLLGPELNGRILPGFDVIETAGFEASRHNGDNSAKGGASTC